MTEKFKKLYKDNVVVEILMVNPPSGQLIRKGRSLQAVNDKVSSTFYIEEASLTIFLYIEANVMAHFIKEHYFKKVIDLYIR